MIIVVWLTCLNPISNILKPPCRKLHPQQTFNNHPSILWSQTCSLNNANLKFRGKEATTTTDPTVLTKCQPIDDINCHHNFARKMPTNVYTKATTVWTFLGNSSVKPERFREISVFMKQEVWSFADQLSRQMMTNMFVEFRSIILGNQITFLPMHKTESCRPINMTPEETPICSWRL